MDEHFERSVRRQLRALRIYAAATTAVAALALLGAAAAVRSASFDVVTVHRINVVDANGTLRLAIFNKDTEPDVIVNGQTLKGRKGPPKAGLMFYNDRGDEQGGIGYSGAMENGRVHQGGLISFDPWEQNDNVDLYFSQDGKNVEEALVFSQTDPRPITYFLPRYKRAMKLPAGPAREAALKQLRDDGMAQRSRLFAGVGGDDHSKIVLSDHLGRPRLQLQVTPAGSASLQVLDENGNATATFPSPASDRRRPLREVRSHR
ncbi:MAG: hypothetical protein M3169_02620 [Candidatus Eremiobacteraeota bacterium]|nr:hypothetical protein [Candidatus Eremiobacteraeota bacterium]